MNRKISGKEIYKGKVVDLFLDEIEMNGVNAKREVIRHRGGVAVLAERNGEFAFVRQYRHPVGEELWEIPAGTREQGEAPEITAVRELEEECGLVADKIEFIGKFAVSPGYTDEIIYLYYSNSFKESRPNLDDDEVLSAYWIDKEKAFSMIESGDIYDGKTLIALYKYRAGLIV